MALDICDCLPRVILGTLDGERGPKPIPWLVMAVEKIKGLDRDQRLYLCPLYDPKNESLGAGIVGDGVGLQTSIVFTRQDRTPKFCDGIL